jgi:xylulokinase
MGGSHAILALDIGLTNCKSVVFSEAGQVLGQSSVAYPTVHTEGTMEQDPGEWWKAVCHGVANLLDAQPELAKQIDGISVTGHMHALVPVGSDREPIANAIILGDQRGGKAARAITDELGLERIYHITGARMEASMPAAKLRWLRAAAPDVFKSARLFTGCKDFVRGILTGGDRFTDPIDACAMSLYDLENRGWSDNMMAAARITADILPEIRPSTMQAGTLQPEAGRSLGLPDGIPVVVGGGDDIEVLGAGLMGPGRAKEHLGTTGSFLTCSEEPVFDPAMSLELYPHADPDLWVVGGSITSAGAALAWAADLLGYGDIGDVLRSEIDILADGQVSPLVFIPHLAGERCPNWNPLARGTWLGLAATHSNDDLMRASFEGTAHALNSILNRIDALVGKQEKILVADRTDESRDWIQLRADVYGRELGVLSTQEPTALGAMILAGVGIGIYPDIREAARQVTNVAGTVTPDETRQERLAHRSHLYQQAQMALQPLWEAMAAGIPDLSIDPLNRGMTV